MATQFFNEVTLSTFVDMMVNKARLDPGIDFDDFFADCRSQMKETLRNPDCIWSDLPKWSSDMAFYEAERVIWEWYCKSIYTSITLADTDSHRARRAIPFHRGYSVRVRGALPYPSSLPNRERPFCIYGWFRSSIT